MVTKYVEYQTPKLTRELASRGFGLGNYGHSKPPKSTMRVEDLIIQILTTNPDPRYVLGIPIIIAKNQVNYQRLINLAKQASALRRVGYLLEVTRVVAEGRMPLNGLEKHVLNIYNLLDETMPEENLYNLSERVMNIYRERVIANELAVKWGVFAWGNISDLKDKFELYTGFPRESHDRRLEYMRRKYSRKVA